MPWTNQAVDLIVLTEEVSGYSGIFGYSPEPGPGNLVFSLAARAGTDPYGNPYPAGVTCGPDAGPQVLLTTAGVGEVTFPLNSTVAFTPPKIVGGALADGSGTFAVMDLEGPQHPAHPDEVFVELNSSDSVSDANLGVYYLDTGGTKHPAASVDSTGFKTFNTAGYPSAPVWTLGGYYPAGASTPRASNTTPGSDPYLQINENLPAGAVLEFVCVVVYTGPASGGDLAFTWQVPPGADFYYSTTYYATSSGNPLVQESHRGSDTPVAYTAGTNTPKTVIMNGYLITSSPSSGGLFLAWAQGTSSSTPTTVTSGSFLRVTQIA